MYGGVMNGDDAENAIRRCMYNPKEYEGMNVA